LPVPCCSAPKRLFAKLDLAFVSNMISLSTGQQR
jgi:hypothetical protein